LRKVSKERVGIELKQMLSHPSAFQTISNFSKFGIFPYTIEIPEKCAELHVKPGTLQETLETQEKNPNYQTLQQCFERIYNLAEKLNALIIKNNTFMFTNTLMKGFKENPAAEARFYLYLGCLMSPFAQYKVEVRSKPLKMENLVPILVKEEVKV
jgi:tRNA nucleotidyltransferase/poly(A) polymerase